MKKVFLLACGLGGVFGCIGLAHVAHAETISAAIVTPTSQEVLLLPESDLEPLPPVEVTQPEVAPTPIEKTVEVATAKAETMKAETVKVASTKAPAPAAISPKFVRVPMHSRIFPALFQ